MKYELYDNTLVITYSSKDIAEMLSEKTGVPTTQIKCGTAKIQIELCTDSES